jgi:hypothetical protein
MLALLAWVTPVAADKKVTVGTRITISYNVPATFTAGAPFYIAHGWSFYIGQDSVSGQNMKGVYDFTLEVDSVYQKADFMDHMLNNDANPRLQIILTVFNFPNGLPAGQHTFTGHWLAPCGHTCANPTTLVEFFTTSPVITFN